MAVALLVGRDEKETKQTLEPTLDLRLWPELGNSEEIEFALVWRHALGALTKLPNLKCALCAACHPERSALPLFQIQIIHIKLKFCRQRPLRIRLQ